MANEVGLTKTERARVFPDAHMSNLCT